MPQTVYNTIHLSGAPLTLADLQRILAAVAVEGEVWVTGGRGMGVAAGAAHVERLMGLLRQRLGPEDQRWLRGMVREEVRSAIQEAQPPI